ncbi:peptidylprolyl isomerase [Novosphingobium sp. 1949]|uniref:peptidylprolyl isomerase n=1 Tax=Novosphingobium organovorum TaxID=2930092 RepID=A0ABT0BHH0_9SPHN|nr:peptidylprolyl isomerase [Novosphingobium organovorum]MCJ2184511.1 peptidylprolyl isomerase [Novosphingobium organovorum]
MTRTALAATLAVTAALSASPALTQANAPQANAPQATPAPAETPAPPPAADPVHYVYVALTTSAGTITLALDTTHAPKTSANFLKYVDAHNLDGAPFYRAMHLKYNDGQDEGLLQGGVRLANKLFPPVAHESTNQTGLRHTAGTISMARFAPGTATADFMILISDMPALDAEKGNDGTDPGAGFAAFGHVIAGMDVVKTIWAMPRSATKGEGVMKGDILENEVPILTARRVNKPAVEPAAQPAPVPAGAPNAEAL